MQVCEPVLPVHRAAELGAGHQRLRQGDQHASRHTSPRRHCYKGTYLVVIQEKINQLDKSMKKRVSNPGPGVWCDLSSTMEKTN